MLRLIIGLGFLLGVLPAAARATELMSARRVAGAAPTIDGLIEPGEWQPSVEYDVSDTAGRSGTRRPPGSVAALFLCDSDFLYLACDVRAVTQRADYDQFGLYVDEDHDHLWAPDTSEGSYHIQYVGGDAVLFNGRPCPDAFSRSGTSSGHLQFEARIPIGPRRSDLTVGPGDTAGLFEYMAQAPGNTYWGWFPPSLLMAHWADPAYYGHLVLDTAANGIGGPTGPAVPEPTLACVSVSGDPVRVSYSTGSGAGASLTVHDEAGRMVRALAGGAVEPGRGSAVWDLTDGSGRRVPAGAYFCRLEVSGRSATARAVVLR